MASPTLGVPAVMDFVEDDERPAVLGAHPVPGRVAGDLGVGDDNAVIPLEFWAFELENRGSRAMPTRAAAWAH